MENSSLPSLQRSNQKKKKDVLAVLSGGNQLNPTSWTLQPGSGDPQSLILTSWQREAGEWVKMVMEHSPGGGGGGGEEEEEEEEEWGRESRL